MQGALYADMDKKRQLETLRASNASGEDRQKGRKGIKRMRTRVENFLTVPTPPNKPSSYNF